jgi:hypothetical protein
MLKNNMQISGVLLKQMLPKGYIFLEMNIKLQSVH